MADTSSSDANGNLGFKLRNSLQRYQQVAQHCLAKLDYTQTIAYLAKICSILDNTTDPALQSSLFTTPDQPPILTLHRTAPVSTDGDCAPPAIPAATNPPFSELDLALVNDLSLERLVANNGNPTDGQQAALPGSTPWNPHSHSHSHSHSPANGAARLKRSLAHLKGVAYWNLGDCYQRAGQVILAETAFEQSSLWFYRARETKCNLLALEHLVQVEEALGKHQLAANLRRRMAKIKAAESS
ncbi:hypothetical protein BJ085DRAFT_31217 [Dimargaris cristalligena]|uniref:Uncharacterized protein n=1 Tax=Dimargaris cristalligena TaxID=215637 RepID=A0A4V1J500_9FUNG|nr:hypothetical protein BJ085DRAFT_31214 [Dimargaris cristalligena]RKP37329.1 hypothetical protein BJ085DRAFT_31217 [Dimargaris cristalligena]|eukprot:RKP37326.1 hypothetical protein BJ085DRAFT_31214 [Dimargaris cristalligena]